jgi:hypothetical protein
LSSVSIVEPDFSTKCRGAFSVTGITGSRFSCGEAMRSTSNSRPPAYFAFKSSGQWSIRTLVT